MWSNLDQIGQGILLFCITAIDLIISICFQFSFVEFVFD